MKIKHFVTIVSLAAGLVISNIAGAKDYQWEVVYFNSNDEEDVSNDEFEVSAFLVNYYFERVSTSKGPYAEADFLSRASTVGLGIFTLEDKPAIGPSTDGDGQSFEVMYFVPNADFFVGFERLSFEFDGGGELDNNTLTVGTYLDDRSTLSLLISSGEFLGFDSSGLGIAYKTLLKAGGKDINIEASVETETIDFPPEFTNTTVSVSGDYYINKQLSVGAGFSSNGGDDTSAEGSAISFEVLYFFTPAVALDIEIEEFSIDDSAVGDDESNITIAIIGRF